MERTYGSGLSDTPKELAQGYMSQRPAVVRMKKVEVREEFEVKRDHGAHADSIARR